MAGASPTPRHIFGLGSGTADNLHWLDEQTAIYSAGQNVVLYSPDTKTQTFLSGAQDSEGICAMCISPNRKFLAVGEKAPKATVTIYDMGTMKRRKVLVSTIAGGKDITCMAFSPDSRYLAVQYGGPDWNLALWTWEKARMAGSARTSNSPSVPIRQVAFSPHLAPDGTAQVSVVGPGICKSFKCADVGGLKPVPIALSRRPDQDFTCHAWLAGGEVDRVIVGTEGGDLMFMEGGEILNPIACGAPVRTLSVYSKGLVVGLGNGLLLVFARDPSGAPAVSEEPPLALLREVSTGLNLGAFAGAPPPALQSRPSLAAGLAGQRTNGGQSSSSSGVPPHQPLLPGVSKQESGGSIIALAITPSEELLGLLTADRRMMTYNLGAVDPVNNDQTPLVAAAPSNHSGEVIALSACVRKPLLATIGADHTLRLWNFRDRALELSRAFDDELTSVALHPGGLFALVGFADKLRLLAILVDDFRMIKEFSIKSCSECCFSHGGHLFAAQSNTMISIFNFFTFDLVATLRGHGGKVKAMRWLPDDSQIVSAGADGAVYQWRLSDQRRVREHVVKGCIYASVALTSGARSIIATGSDKILRELEESTGGNTSASREVETGCQLIKLAVPSGNKCFFAGTENGRVRMYKLPLTGDYTEVRVGLGPVNMLELGQDDAFLYVATADGAVSVFDLPPAPGMPRRQMGELNFAEEVVVGKAEMDDKRQRIQELELQVTEMTMQHEYQIRLRDANAQDRLRVANEEAAKETAALRARNVALQRAKEEQEAEQERAMRKAEHSHQGAVLAMESQHGQRLGVEADRYAALQRDMAQALEAAAADKQATADSHSKSTSDLTKRYDVQLQHAAKALEQTRTEGAQAAREGEEMRGQIEMDADREVEMQRERYETQLAGERDASQRLKAENVVLQRKMGDMAAQMEALRNDMAALHAQKKALQDNVAELESDVRGLKRECTERDELLLDKDRRIADVKGAVVELQKLKFVLEYKVDELRAQALPREQKLDALNAQISEMDKELARYHASNTALHAAVSDSHKQQAALRQDMNRRVFEARSTATQLRQIQGQIAEAVKLILEPDSLKAAVVKLYQMHVEGTDHNRKSNVDIEQEFGRQRDYLEKTVADLKSKLAMEASNHGREQHKALQENMVLVKEIASLKQELKSASGRALIKSKTMAKRSSSNGSRITKDSTTSLGSKPRESIGTEDMMRSMGVEDLIPSGTSIA